MSAATDTYCALSQPAAAMYGNSTTLLLAITNTSASTAYSPSSMQVWATNATGKPTASARIQQPTFPVNGTSSVAASTTIYVPVSAQFFGQPVVGIPSAANENFLLTANILYSDGTSISSPVLAVTLTDPIWGTIGSPPGPAFVVSSLQFSTPANSGLHLLGWV